MIFVNGTIRNNFNLIFLLLYIVFVPCLSLSQTLQEKNEVTIGITTEEINSPHPPVGILQSCEDESLQLPQLTFEIDYTSDAILTIKLEDDSLEYVGHRTPILIDCVDFTELISNGSLKIPRAFLAQKTTHTIDIFLFTKKDHQKLIKRVVLNNINKSAAVAKPVSMFNIKPVGGVSINYQDLKQSGRSGSSFSAIPGRVKTNIPQNLNFESVFPLGNNHLKSNVNLDIKNNHAKSTNYLYTYGSEKSGLSYGLQPVLYSGLTLPGQSFYGLKSVNKIGDWDFELDGAQIAKPREGTSSYNGMFERRLYGGRLAYDKNKGKSTNTENKIGLTFYRAMDRRSSISVPGPFLTPLSNTVFGIDWKVKNKFGTALDIEIAHSKSNADAYARRDGGSGTAFRLNLTKTTNGYNYSLSYDQMSDKYFAAGRFSPINNNQNFNIRLGLPFKKTSNFNIIYSRGKTNRKSTAQKPSNVNSSFMMSVDLKVIRNVSIQISENWIHSAAQSSSGLASDRLQRNENINLSFGNSFVISHTNRDEKDRLRASTRTTNMSNSFQYNYDITKKLRLNLRANDTENENLFTGYDTNSKQWGLNLAWKAGKISPNIYYSINNNTNSLGTQDSKNQSFSLSMNYTPARSNSALFKPNYSFSYTRSQLRDQFNYRNNYTTGSMNAALNLNF